MNPLQRTLIEKAGHDNGFEHALAQSADAVTLASARHRARAVVSVLPAGDFTVLFQSAAPALLQELRRCKRRSISAQIWRRRLEWNG